MKYVLMFADTEQFAADLAAMDEPEREHAYARVHQWFAEHHDKIIHHTHLMPPDSATTVRLDQGEPLITDGPFVEGKEVVSGFAEIDVADLDEALRLARSWPACPIVEIRPIAA
ncbi:YciI family protein [Micromonospora sp. WMMD812]|uniref:YciI family protein n=1 Tax=Micromonospora sp. WMMD812 TaxID=3015152 RepID=UPI00248BEF2C|nr:YciI family protein [Micromonospora sp. WMMD812]WBB69183.1 YciI family protein [Micromonospora sp. WMMD812]